MTPLSSRKTFFAKNLEYFFLLAVRQGAYSWGEISRGKIGGKPGQTLLQATVFNTDRAGQQLNEVARVIPIGRQAALREQADFFDWQVVDFNIGPKQEYVRLFLLYGQRVLTSRG